jgi:hypothetical protein
MTNQVFRYIIYCKDGHIFKHNVVVSFEGKSHKLLEDFMANGVTVLSHDTQTWTRISPHYINFIEMREVQRSCQN